MNYEEMMMAFREEKPILYGGIVYPRISAIITKKIVPGFSAVCHIAELEAGKNIRPVLCEQYELLKIYDKKKHNGLIKFNFCERN